MLENFNTSTELKFKELSPEEKQKRGILGRLYGPIASIVQSTRNGRRYTESLWEKVFENPLTKEMFSQGGVPGELDHPIDREETCSEKIAIMMPEPPTKDNEGHLIGYFDIIDTPCGRIAYSLAKYGFNLGISSRGSGDTFMDADGQETVDEDTYSFNAFDLVLLPACKDARLQLAESFNIKRSKFNEAIEKELKNATEGDKKIMTETLKNLKFLDNKSPETQGDKELNETNEKNVADNDGTDLVESLQEALKENQNLHKQVLMLQERLSVSYTKELKQEAQITKLKGAVRNLTESVGTCNALKAQIQTMKTQLNNNANLIQQQKRIIESTRTKLIDSVDDSKQLNESITHKDNEIIKLKRKVATLNENVKTVNSEHNRIVESLQNEISELKTESEIKKSQYSRKLQQSNQLVESYKLRAKTALDKYIEIKATNLGINTNDIKSRLTENYSFNDVDKVCENLRSYRRNISKLPFNLNEEYAKYGNVAMKYTTDSKVAQKPITTNPDDVVDQDLYNLLNN